MIHHRILSSILVCALASSVATASSESSDERSDCDKIKGTKDFVMCALQAHPDVQETIYDKKIADGLVQQARRFPNPELDADISQTDNIGQTSDTVELKLLMPIEIGGRRGARIKKSKAESDLIQSEILKTQESVVIETLLKLSRLRQVIGEIELTAESLSTFSKVKKQYSRRKSLGPEQAVSLDIFSLAEADYSMRQSALESEKGEILRELSFHIGRTFKEDEFLLPEFASDWPDLPTKSDVVGSEMQIAKAKKRIAEGELEMARSEAWPDLAIGPTYSLETENNDKITTVGISIEMPLPLFNLNGGNKAVALAGQHKAAIHQKSQVKNLRNVRANLVQIYSLITKRLKKMDPRTLGQKKHARIHKYLKRGVVSASLVIESHRQIVEFQEHTNEQELRALSALWQVRALDGNLLKEVENLKNP